MEEIISKSKYFKAEKAKEKEENEKLVDKLASRFESVKHFLDESVTEVEASTNQVSDQEMPVYDLPSKILFRVLNVQLKVEKCLTSNICTETLSFDLHHFADLHKAKHPIVLCTDDLGVFSTTLSCEYALASSTFGLGRSQMFQLAQNAIEFVFADDEVKSELRQIFYSAERKLDFV